MFDLKSQCRLITAMYFSISVRWCNHGADQLLCTVWVKRVSRKFEHMHDIGDLTVKQYAFILNTIFSTQDTLKKLNKIKKNKTNLSHPYCCRFLRLFRKPVCSSWCLRLSINTCSTNCPQVKGYDAFYLIKSQWDRY